MIIIIEKLRQFIHKGIDVFKLAIDRGKADVSHFIKGFQFVHDKSPITDSINLAFQRVLKFLLNFVGNFLKFGNRDQDAFHKHD